MGVTATNATLSSDAVHLAAGALASAPLRVTSVAAGAARLTASVPALPDTRCGLLGLYRCYRGVTLTAGAPLVLFKAPPRATGEAPRAELGTDGDALRIDLSGLFAASDGGALTYTARSGDPGLVSVHVAGRHPDRHLDRGRRGGHDDGDGDGDGRGRAVDDAHVRGDRRTDAGRPHARAGAGCC